MKKSVLATMALSLFCSLSLFSQGITLFWDANFSGESIVITSDWDATSNMYWNDQISSIRIPPGYKIQVFEHTNFGGASKTLSGDWTVTGNSFNDFISSIKIIEYPAKGITVYRDANFQGDALEINSDWDASSDMSWNDQISSIRIPAGIRIQVFEHVQFEGASKTLTHDWTVKGDDFNDFISSIKFLGPEEKMPVVPPVASMDRLCCGQSLSVGGVIESPNRRFFLVLQNDRNLVLYMRSTMGDKPLWATATNNNADMVTMQVDGNLGVYNGTRAVWASNTSGNYNASLVVQDDGNLVIYAAGNRAVWATNTAQPVEPVVVTPIATAAPCAMSEQQLNGAVHAIKSQSFRDGKMQMAKQAIKNKCLSLDQIRTLGKLFSFEDQTLEFVKHAYNFTDNKDEYYTLADIFTFKSNADNFMKFLNSK